MTCSILHGDSLDMLKTLPEKSVNCCVTSPPYWGLRQYLPDVVKLKTDAPQWVIDELESLGIYPIDK